MAPKASAEEGPDAEVVRFQMYTNYPHFIDRAEIRIFDRDQSVRATPLDVVEVGWDGLAEWRPAAAQVTPPRRELQFVLRAYDADGRFDETAPQPLWLVPSQTGPVWRVPWFPGGGASERAGLDESEEAAPYAALLGGYGKSGLVLQNIPLGNAGTVNVQGSGIPPHHSVWLAGDYVPVDAEGKFVAETLLPTGTHTVEVAVVDERGVGRMDFVRGQGEVKRLGHLGLGFTSGAGHGERGGDAAGGEEKVALFLGDGVEEIIRKLIVAGDQLVQGSWSNVESGFLAHLLREGRWRHRDTARCNATSIPDWSHLVDTPLDSGAGRREQKTSLRFA